MDLENSKALKMVIKEELKKAITEQAREVQTHLRDIDRRLRELEGAKK
jgi:hypothetical protein